MPRIPLPPLTHREVSEINEAYEEVQAKLKTTHYGGHPDQLKAAVMMFDKWPKIHNLLANGGK